MTASQWFDGAKIRKRMDLKPNEMLETHKSFDLPPSHHQIRAQKITTGNKYQFVCLFPSPRRLVSSLKAQSMTQFQSESTAPPII
jgi:hypothetical protein